MSKNPVSPLICWVLLLTSICFLSVARSVNLADESWFLQVVHRFSTGETLYRDIFFGVTPLSIYLTALFTSVFGLDILVVRAVLALCFVLTACVAFKIVKRLGAERRFPVLPAMALLAFAYPGADEVGVLYTPLANLFFLGCFYTAILYCEEKQGDCRVVQNRRRDAFLLGFAGAAAGLCFVSKQSTGLLALAALLLTVIAAFKAPRPRFRSLSVAVLPVIASFTLISALVLLPVWLSGGMEKFSDYAFLNKSTYLRLGGVSYLEGVFSLAFPAGASVFSGLLKGVYRSTVFLLPLITAAAIIATRFIVGPNQRGLANAVLFFTGAALMGIYPRADFSHLTQAVPALLIGLIYAWYRLKPILPERWVRQCRTVLVFWLGIGVVLTFLIPCARLWTGRYQVSTLPHFHLAFVASAQQDEIRTPMKELLEAAGGERLFLLSPNASFYYLAAGLKNPTPFDYPLATAFGRNGEAEVMAAIVRREITTVGLDSRGLSAQPLLCPIGLEHYVLEHMEPERDFGFCTLYRSHSPTAISRR